MRFVLAPEPAPWLARLPTLLGDGSPAHVLAPWSLPSGPERWTGVPERLRTAWRRRVAEGGAGAIRVWGLPGWWTVEAGLRWRGRSAAAGFQARFLLREALGRAAAPLLPAGVDVVVAPSLAARELFARARRRGARCVLVEDLPSLRELHADLDEAARHHPEEDFLRNHRARARDVARQEAERVLADDIWVRGALARERLMAAGHAPERLRELRPLEFSPPPPFPISPEREGREEPAKRVALLAGPALARSGLREALAVLEARPRWTLLVRPTEGSPVALLTHPRVRSVSVRAWQELQGVDVVLALSWCECHPPELVRAAARGVPVIATDRAAGFNSFPRVPRGDVSAILSALDGLEG